MTTPAEIAEEQFKKAGLTAQYKRRCKDGTLEDATEKELQVLKVQSQIAAAAQQLQQIPPEDRTSWAVEMKDYANKLYAQGHVCDAMNKYTEALTASNFSKTSGNVEILVLPVLCNLAACCIQIGEYGKGVRFCDQALELKADSGKAQMRKGICFFHLGEFDRALTSLDEALKIVHRSIADHDSNISISSSSPINDLQAVSSSAPFDSLDKRNDEKSAEITSPPHLQSGNKMSETTNCFQKNNYKMAERDKILSYISRTMKNLEVQKTNVSNQRNAMRKAFASPKGLAEKRSRSRDRKCVGLKSPTAITGPPSRHFMGIVGTIRNVVGVVCGMIMTFFFGSKYDKSD